MTTTQAQGQAVAGEPGAIDRWRVATWLVADTGLWGALALGLVAMGMTGCDGLTKSDQLPSGSGLTDPAVTQTREGALQAYRGTVVQFRRAFGGPAGQSGESSYGGNFAAAFVAITGELTDELQGGHVAAGDAEIDESIALDRRASVTGSSAGASDAYSALQRVRGQAGQALGLLRDYAPDQPALQSHIYALEGYAEVFLSELFCSGIPLSTLDYKGDYTLHPGSSTQDVLKHAAALFDSALGLAGDSALFRDLARLGKARALLGLGDYEQAAAAVSAVDDNFSYVARFAATTLVSGTNVGADNDDQRNFVSIIDGNGNPVSWLFSVADREGQRGLDYVSSGDPRTATNVADGRRVPAKYTPDGSGRMVVASGIEGRLIEAEAALQARDTVTWLAKLNELRQTAWATILDCSTGPCQSPTTRPAALADLTDPGTDSARVDLLFRERAFWLFLTGHRQGDLRRQLRQYPQYWPSQDQLYPSGPYPTGGFYGSDVTLLVPSEERSTNPQYTGCASTGA